jgi:hypothetical protein
VLTFSNNALIPGIFVSSTLSSIVFMNALNEVELTGVGGAMSTDLRVLAVVLTITLALPWTPAVIGLAAAAPDKNQEPPLCEDFHRDITGSWVATRKVTLSGVAYDAGTAFTTGVTFAGKDWGALLDQKCK